MINPLDVTRIRGIHKFVPLPEAEDHLRTGWMAVLTGEPHPVHREWSVHMVWVCRCKMVIPGRMAA
jgi:hypothetical protein